MKYLSIFMIVFMGMAMQGNAQADAISKYFDQYVEDERFTVVYISPRMFSLFSQVEVDDMDEDSKDIMEIAKNLRGLRILTTEQNSWSFYQEAMDKINTSEYEILMTVRDEEENVRFYIKDNGEKIEELLLLVGSTEEFVLISFVGNIDLKSISKLANNMDIKGTEHLDKLNEENENEEH